MRTILLADAAASVRDLVKAMLQRNDLTFAEAQDATEALLAVRDGRPALVFLDRDLPPWGGLELLRRMREVHNVPVVVLALQDHVVESQSLVSKGVEVLLKPLDGWRLVAAAECVLGPESAERPSQSGSHE